MEINGMKPNLHQVKPDAMQQASQNTEVRANQMKALETTSEEKTQLEKLHEENGSASGAEQAFLPTLQDVQEVKGQFDKQSVEAQVNKPPEVSEVRAKEQVAVEIKAQQAYQTAASQVEPSVYGQSFDGKF